MKTLRPLLALLTVGLGACTRPEPAPPPARSRWLSGDTATQLDTLATHLRGNDVAMWEIAHRHRELERALAAANWDYADYQLDKIELVIQLATERRPARRASYETFVRTALRPLRLSVERHDAANAANAFQHLTRSCRRCHATEGIPFIPVEASPPRPSSAP